MTNKWWSQVSPTTTKKGTFRAGWRDEWGIKCKKKQDKIKAKVKLLQYGFFRILGKDGGK